MWWKAGVQTLILCTDTPTCWCRALCCRWIQWNHWHSSLITSPLPFLILPLWSALFPLCLLLHFYPLSLVFLSLWPLSTSWKIQGFFTQQVSALRPNVSPVFLLHEPRDYKLKAFGDITPLPSFFFTPSFLTLSLFPASLRSSMSPWGGCFVSCGGWKEGALTGRPILLLWRHKLTQACKCFCVQHKPTRVERAGEGGWGWRGCDREREQIAAVLKWSLP